MINRNDSRIRKLNNKGIGSGPVVYWMSRDQRLDDNPALLWAQKMAIDMHKPLVILFVKIEHFLCANERVYEFMESGLRLIRNRCDKYNIKFVEVCGGPVDQVVEFSSKFEISLLVGDFSPLKFSRHWKEEIANKIDVSMVEVDAHNVIPAWLLSDKQEFGAVGVRNKFFGKIGEWYEEFPKLIIHPYDDLNLNLILNDLCLTKNKEIVSSPENDWDVGLNLCKLFVKQKLPDYRINKNNPIEDCQSGLSPFIHFGQISVMRVLNILFEEYNIQKNAINKIWREKSINRIGMPVSSLGLFVEELLVRRELSENYCFYNQSYDSFDGLPEWSKKTLNLHKEDIRDYIYEIDEWEKANTHDELWNASQRQLVLTGKMHGYMRMYWGKKILEWSKSPEEAMRIAIYLNDKYELDGRDPNGYAGIAWAIGGLHDKPWLERKVFGKIRYMNANGCRKKFDVDKYIGKWSKQNY